MRFNMKKIAALAMAATMCMPMSAFAAQTSTATSGSITTDFDLYSPALHISVPVKAQIRVNPIADTANVDTEHTVSSNSIDVINASVDEKIGAVPVNVTAQATLTSAAEDVVTLYNRFAPDGQSKVKKIYLELAQAVSGSEAKLPNSPAALGADGKVDFSQVNFDTAAAYKNDGTTQTNVAPVTQYGSSLSVDIAKPTVAANGDVTPTVGSFAVIGRANANADWKKDDVKVEIRYVVKAAPALSITTPAVTPAPVYNAASPADATFVIPDVGESQVIAMALHNNASKDFYGDFLFENDAYQVTYAPSTASGAPAGQIDATITIPEDNGTLTFLTGADYTGKAQDLIIALSDGRKVVTTLTATAAPATP